MRQGLAVAAVLGVTGAAQAYCRTRTCNERKQDCAVDAEGCAHRGAPVYWNRASVEVEVVNGSARRGISKELAQALMQQALDAWTSVTCEGEGPSIAASATDSEGQAESLVDQRRQRSIKRGAGGDVAPVTDGPNTVLFMDDEWFHDGEHAIALTTLTFAVDSGRLVHADIDLNSLEFPFTLTDDHVQFDLLSVFTHEAGHLFGLDDLLRTGPTMYGHYFGGHVEPRSLAPDDVAGMCAIYPPGREIEGDGGCACRASNPSSDAAPLSWALVALGAATLRVRRRRRDEAQSRGARARRV